MQPRDVFDGIVVALVAVVVYVEVFGVGVSDERVDRLFGFVDGFGFELYLLIAGVLGVVFVGYIVLYAPGKYRTDVGR